MPAFHKSRRKNTVVEVQEAIKRMLAQGVSQRQIARTMNVHQKTVSNVAKRGVTSYRRRKRIEFLPEHVSCIKQICDTGLPLYSSFQTSIYTQFKEKFPNFEVSISSFRNYLKNEMKYSPKLVKHIENGRNDMETILGRFLWLQSELIDREIDFFNCVFVDECAFIMGDGIKTAWSKKGVTPVCNTEKGFSDSKQSITCIGAISIAGILCIAVKTKDNISVINPIENSNLTIDQSDFVSHLRLLKQKYPMMSDKLFECRDDGNCTAEAYGTRRVHFMSFLWNLMLKMKAIKNEFQHKYIYLDNASIHHGITVQEMVIFFNQSYGTKFELLYGFKYSPDLNPIELFWKLLRDRYRPLGGFDNIVDRLVNAASQIPIQKIKNCIYHTEKMIRLVKNFEPLCISKFNELNVAKRPMDAYKTDPSFHLIKSFDEIGGKNKLKCGMLSGDLVLFHIGKFGNGFRVYFKLGNSRYSCAKTLFNDDMKEWLDSAEKISTEPFLIQINDQIPSDGIEIRSIDYKSGVITIMDKDGIEFLTRFEKLVKLYPSEILEFYLEEKNKNLKILSRRRELAEQHKKLALEKKRLRSEKATEVLNRKTERLLKRQRNLEIKQKKQEAKQIQQEKMAAVKKNLVFEEIRRKQLKLMKKINRSIQTYFKNKQKEAGKELSKHADQKDNAANTRLYSKKRKREHSTISSHVSNIPKTTTNEPEIQEIMNITKTRRRVRFVKEGEEQIIPLDSFTRKYPGVLKAYYKQNPEISQG